MVKLKPIMYSCLSQFRYDDPFDLDEVKHELQTKDVDKGGRIKKEEVFNI